MSSNQRQKMNDSFCCCRVGFSMIGEEDTSNVTLPVFCFTVSLNALTCATVPPQKWTLSSRQVAGCVANCGTLLFPNGVGPFLQSLENGKPCCKMWRLLVFPYGVGPFLQSLENGWLSPTVALCYFPME